MAEGINLEELKKLGSKALSAQLAEKDSSALSKEAISGAVSRKSVKEADSLGRYYATGRRKTAKARLWLKAGHGHMMVNGKDIKDYFPQMFLRSYMDEPLRLLGAEARFDIISTVKGSGISGQAGALRHALARALADFKSESRTILKKAKMLMRDPRAVERKKAGQPKARKRFQFSKR